MFSQSYAAKRDFFFTSLINFNKTSSVICYFVLFLEKMFLLFLFVLHLTGVVFVLTIP